MKTVNFLTTTLLLAASAFAGSLLAQQAPPAVVPRQVAPVARRVRDSRRCSSRARPSPTAPSCR